MNMHGTLKTQVERLTRLARINLIPGVSMICTEMFGNGFKIIGMKTTMELLQMEVYGKMEIAHTGSLVGVVGTAMPVCAVQLAVSGVIPRTVSATWASAS